MNQTQNQTLRLANPSAKRIAYIEASWHKDICEQARFTFTADLAKAGIKENQIDVFHVPGSLEIPLQAKLLAKTGKYDIIVGCGFVVNGGIYRHDFVASTIIDAFMQVQLETEIPILSVVLTPLNYHEHEEHHRFFFEHFKVKGVEAANACLRTLENIEALQQLRKAA